jgi:hypothetical protein
MLNAPATQQKLQYQAASFDLPKHGTVPVDAAMACLLYLQLAEFANKLLDNRRAPS